MKRIFLFLTLLAPLFATAQDTTVVQTLTYDSTAREGVWIFPDDPNKTYEKVLLQYSMRCHNQAVGNGNVGCREWDYHCNTVITDSSRTDSLRRTTNSHSISNFSGSSFAISNAPTYTYYDFDQYDVQYTSVLAETTATVGAGAMAVPAPFSSSIPRVKTQYLWTASELSTAGLGAGNLTGLRVDLSSLGSALGFLRIGVKATSKTQLDPDDPDLDGFSEVYFSNTSFQSTGIHSFNFYNPFYWDGSSNLILEFSYKNGSAGTNSNVNGMALGNDIGLQSSKAESHIEVLGTGGVDLPTNSLSGVSNEITVSFWAYGDATLPQNSTVFEGADANGLRQANVHLPWSNGRVYWDCGNDGTGYDRIDYAANTADIEGRWVHWAFTKNATTGDMRIYVDGQMVHSGTGNNRAIDIQDFRFGAANRSTHSYYGKIDEFRVWNVELSAAAIQDWMFEDVTNAHPNYANLLGYYKLDDASGNTALDASPNNAHGTVLSGTSWRDLGVEDYWRNFNVLTNRPNATFVKGSYTQTVTTTTIRDSIINAQNAVEEFGVVGSDLISQGTNLYYQAGWQYVYDENGMVTDSVLAATDSTILISILTYYTKTPSRYEILSFITPYGNGLDLGPDGVMWTIDVTDYLPILTGPKRMSIEGVGRNQEELDLRFLFIEGTPPRDVLDVQQLWPIQTATSVWYGWGFDDLINNVHFEPREVVLDPTSSMWKLRSAITGHGQNGEFIARWHFLNIDGGQEEFRWQAWKECADMPVYPQGGTWLYDRAGWCPGVPTDVAQYEMDPYVNAGDTVEIDYGMDQVSNTSASDYRIANQLVTYGPINHTLDAAVVEVKRPSKRVEFARFNPACNEPTVVIRNTGSTTLTSLTITYNVRGGSTRTFNWSGSLEFLEEEEVALPVDNPNFWQTSATESVFEVEISAPNGGADQYAWNNVYASEFEAWDSYLGGLSLRWRTNNKFYENNWRILDETGATVLQSSPFLTANTIYVDDLNLPMGCYTLRFNDNGDDGLYYWALTSQGTGFAHFREYGLVQKQFEPEFGKFFQYDFWTDGIVGGVEVDHPELIRVYPNPTEGEFSLEMQGWENIEVRAEVYDLQGKKVAGKEFEIGSGYAREFFDLSEVGAGTYFMRIWDGERMHVKEIVKQ